MTMFYRTVIINVSLKMTKKCTRIHLFIISWTIQQIMFLLQDSCGSQRAPQAAGDMGGEEGRRKLVDSSRSELGTWTAWADPATGEEEEEREVGTTSGDCKELPSSAKPSLVRGERGGDSQESSSSFTGGTE